MRQTVRIRVSKNFEEWLKDCRRQQRTENRDSTISLIDITEILAKDWRLTPPSELIHGKKRR